MTPRSMYRPLTRWLIVMGCASVASMAHAADALMLDVPAGPLLDCLEHLARASGRRIVDRSGKMSTARCEALRGSSSVEAALQRWLPAQGLGWRRLDDGTLVIVTEATPRWDLDTLVVEDTPLDTPDALVAPRGPAPTPLAERAGAITTIDRAWLDHAPLRNFSQLGHYAPNVSGSGQGLSVRGLVRDSDLFTALTVRLDGIDLGTRLLDQDLVPLDELEQIDLARGPRAFESGGASAAGGVRLYTADPAVEPTLRSTVGIGDAAAWRAAASWSGPVFVDGLGARVSVQRRVLEQDVVPTPAAGAKQRINDSVQSKFVYRPESRPEWSASLATLFVDGDSSERLVPIVSPGDPPPTLTSGPLQARTHAVGYAGSVRYAPGDSLAFEANGADTAIEQRGSIAPYYRLLNREDHSRQAVTARYAPLDDWILATGVERSDDSVRLHTNRVNALYDKDDFSTHADSAWLWAEHHWNDTLAIGAGLRRMRLRSVLLDTDATVEMEQPAATQRQSLSIPLANVEWQPWPGHTVSLSHGRGFKSGGAVAPGTTYRAERERSTELSWRDEWEFGLRSRVAVFRANSDDRYSGFYNLPSAGAKQSGGEAEAQMQWGPRWRLRAGIGWLSSRYVDGGVALGNGVLPGAPSRTITAGLQYREAPGFFASADAYHASRAIGGEGSAPSAELNLHPYTLLDLAAGYLFARSEIALSASNVFDAEYIDRAGVLGRDVLRVYGYHPGEGRRVELRWRQEW